MIILRAIMISCNGKVEKSSSGNKTIRVLVSEVFKAVNDLSQNYMKDIFTPKRHAYLRLTSHGILYYLC